MIWHGRSNVGLREGWISMLGWVNKSAKLSDLVEFVMLVRTTGADMLGARRRLAHLERC